MMEEVNNLDLYFGPDPVVSLDVANEPFSRDSESLRRSRINSFALPAGDSKKKCENGSKVMEEEDNVTTEEKSVGSFFDCYICMDLSKDPVVTNCGHLYCWFCLYRWLQVSVAKECPVCKGEISVKTLTPIYGRGDRNKGGGGSEEVSDTNNKIPSRPQARRVAARVRSRLHRPGYIGREIINRILTLRRVRAERVRAEQNQERETMMRSSRGMSIRERDTDDTYTGVSVVDSADSRPLRRRRLA
ncbi:hypothetical protein N665_0364s0034 [Sinapis alba]|nr:hypothetical protein N665_0364s0034 [Sinapis alba]